MKTEQRLQLRHAQKIRVTRMSSMLYGQIATFEINGAIVTRKVFCRNNGGLYIKYNKAEYYLYEMPLGKEVII